MLGFPLFRTGCRSSAIADAKVGDLHRTNTDYFLSVTEKENKRETKALLEAAAPLLRYMEVAGSLSGPCLSLFVRFHFIP